MTCVVFSLISIQWCNYCCFVCMLKDLMSFYFMFSSSLCENVCKCNVYIKVKHKLKKIYSSHKLSTEEWVQLIGIENILHTSTLHFTVFNSTCWSTKIYYKSFLIKILKLKVLRQNGPFQDNILYIILLDYMFWCINA